MRSKHLHRRTNTLSRGPGSRDTLREAPERVFLVGVDYHTRASGEGKTRQRSSGKEPGSIGVPAEARAARDAAQPRSTKGNEVRGFTAEDSLAELQELTLSAGAEVVGQFLQRREKPDPATLIGRGKLEEVAGAAASAHTDLIIFDHELTPSQQRNIEREAHCRIIDRTQLILDIFARHARTREGQMQVELAQLQYLLPRLTGRGIEMSQLGGGIGTRGPGETQLETDRRRINRRIQHIKRQLENVRRIRGQQRQRRESVPVATVALVGYTNAGKSTLFNALTRANVLASSRMFATLDPTLRSVTLPSRRKILLSDTVGFIRNLPHTLVSAFRATLEEVQRAALILHVSDATSPNREVQDAQVEAVLRELSVYEKPRLMVLNKIDLLGAAQRQSLLDTQKEVHVSAKQGIGLGTLLDRIDELLQEDAVSRVRLRVPQQEGKVLSLLEARARIFSRSYHDGLVELEAQAPESLLRKLRPFVME